MIGQLSSESGFPLVVPIYFVCAGILLYTGITAAIVGLWRERVPLYIAFAATCLLSAGVSISMASYYLADSVGGAVEALRWGSAAAILFLGALFVFVAIYTGARDMGRGYVAVGALLLAISVANGFLPLGMRFSEVESYGWLHLPWGEAVFRLDGRVSAWNVAFRLLSAAVVAWSVWRLLELNRQGKRRDAVVLAAYLLVVFGASFHGALIDLGLVRTVYSVPIAFVGLALLMSVNLVMRIGEYNRVLKSAAADLQVENERRREAEADLRTRAYTDALTGLPNRSFMQERLATLMEMGPADSQGALLICDLDHFKVINNALSHEVGDQLLREVAARIAEAVRGEGTVARLGGNAFLVVLEGMHADEALARSLIGTMADDVARAVARTTQFGAHCISLTASIGTATFPARGASANEIIVRADLALHRAKKRGRNNIQAFLPSDRDDVESRFRLIDGLRRAVGADELALHFQPQIDMNGRVAGAEALMRWTSAAMGSVSPGIFIPIAEESGLIHELGEWSLRAGCERLAAWKRDGIAFDGHLSINVSPWQLARPQFVERLVQTVEASGIDPHRLTLEITESVVLFDVSETVAKLREIRPIGVRIALDDFGTGYSSLALIKDLPLDAIKIDQSFVRHLEEGANKQLIRVVVAIGAELGLEVIAEGVETRREVDALLALGCTNLQGYYFARPMPEAEFLQWLAARGYAGMLARSLST